MSQMVLTADTSVEWIDMSVRVRNACKALGIETVRDYMLTPDFVFLRHPNFGRKSMNEVNEVRSQIEYTPTVEDMRAYIARETFKVYEEVSKCRKLIDQWETQDLEKTRKILSLEGQLNKMAHNVVNPCVVMNDDAYKARVDAINETHAEYTHLFWRFYLCEARDRDREKGDAA